ncbi:MAG: electron transport complex subunit RsxC [Clostridia bacterium]|nr:electron transport complex subunit RsxC [Clostridia bacterium]
MSKIADGILKAVKQVKGGVLVDHHKDTKDMATVRITPPERVILPMQQHIGAPCSPIVKVGDHVDVGQKIADSDQYVSAPIHASVSGKVTAVSEVKVANGRLLPAITIENDGEMTLSEDIKPPKVENKADLIKAIRNSGLVGLGGAGFPSHVKFNIPDDKNIDTLIINAAECEPFITVDYRECIENTRNIVDGVYLLKDILGFKNIIIAVEDNKPDAIKILKDIADMDNHKDNAVKVMTLKSKYPQGAEKMMVQSATGRIVPAGKLPADVGCVVANVGSVAFIARHVRTGRPIISRTLTVSGSAIANPMNVRVPVGIEASKVIDFCGGFKKDPVKIIAGGPMMGTALIDTDVPILKSNNALLAFADETRTNKKERACIRCGRCVAACPMNLIPTDIEALALSKDADALGKAGIMVCMECGSCAYSCPAGKPLVQYMRLGKDVIRQAGANK